MIPTKHRIDPTNLMEVIEAACRREMRPLTVAAAPWRYGGRS